MITDGGAIHDPDVSAGGWTQLAARKPGNVHCDSRYLRSALVLQERAIEPEHLAGIRRER